MKHLTTLANKEIKLISGGNGVLAGQIVGQLLAALIVSHRIFNIYYSNNTGPNKFLKVKTAVINPEWVFCTVGMFFVLKQYLGEFGRAAGHIISQQQEK